MKKLNQGEFSSIERLLAGNSIELIVSPAMDCFQKIRYFRA